MSAARPTFNEDGTVQVPAFELPPSELSSPEAQAFMRLRAQMPGGAPTPGGDIARMRRELEAMLAPQVEAMLRQYPVEVAEGEIAGVPVRIVTPEGGVTDTGRVLMNVHGGAFSLCWPSCAMIESIPIAALSGLRIVTVDYRMAPEAAHPAGVEDAGAVYRALLADYDPKHVGIFGCSAGGALSAQLAAWLPANGLPQAGAIGIFGAGGVRFNSGDSAYLAGYIDGSFEPPPGPGQRPHDITNGYFSGHDMKDPIISPALHPEVMAKFPPTLIITGTRAMDMSPAIVTNLALIKAGVPSRLIVGEGMGHCYIYQSQLPEARDSYDMIVAFFREYLG